MNKIDIARLLKKKPKGMQLYSTAIGKCELLNVGIDDIIVRDYRGNDYSLDRYGVLIDTDGECILFPAKEMQDWDKFSWKKGDVLGIDTGSYCIFEDWVDDNYTQFKARYIYNSSNSYFDFAEVKATCDWSKMLNNNSIALYISKIEECYDGKLNLKTLQIENQPQFNDGDIVAMDIKRSTDIAILKEITTEDIVFHTVLRDGKDLLLDEPCKVNVIKLRLATEEEKRQLFNVLAKNGKRWNPDTKQIVDFPKSAFKTFEYILVKNEDRESAMWQLYQYSHENEEYIYTIGSLFGLYKKYIKAVHYNKNTARLLGTTDDYDSTILEQDR